MTHWGKRLPWQRPRIMSVMNIYEMPLEGVKSKLESFIQLSCGVFEKSRTIPKGEGEDSYG